MLDRLAVVRSLLAQAADLQPQKPQLQPPRQNSAEPADRSISLPSREEPSVDWTVPLNNDDVKKPLEGSSFSGALQTASIADTPAAAATTAAPVRIVSSDLAERIAADPAALAKLVVAQDCARSWLRRRRFFQLVEDASSSDDRDLSGARKRAAVAREITETERSFLHQMQLLLRCFFVPFADSELFTREELRSIFSNLEGIVTCSEVLLGKLEEKDSTRLHNRIGSVFLDMVTVFAIFTDFINAFDSGQLVLRSLMEKPGVIALTRGCRARARADYGSNLDLADLLIQPVQRLPRYVMLLEELFKSTPDDHVDKANLASAIAGVRAITTKINDAKRRFDSIDEILAIQESLQGNFLNLVEPHRRFYHKGVLTQLWGDKANQGRELMFFCFNDILIYALPMRASLLSRKTQRFEYLSFFTFSKNVTLVTDLTTRPGLSAAAAAAPHAFMLEYTESMGGSSFVMGAKTLADKTKWIESITRCLRERNALLDVSDSTVGSYEASDLFKVVRKLGWLTKRGDNIKSWKRRCFKLKGRTLFYYADAASSQPLGQICLRTRDAALVEMLPSTLKPYCLELRPTECNPSKRSYFVASDSGSVLASWIEKLAEEARLGPGLTELYQKATGNRLSACKT